MKKDNTIKAILRGHLWLLMAVFCIVFSSASKKLIEQKVNPTYYAPLSFSKKIKDGSRDKRDYLNKITLSDKQQSQDNSGPVFFLLSTLISIALLYLASNSIQSIIFKEQHLALRGIGSLYLQHHRLQV